MSGLAHYFEEEGIPTVVVALVREHAQKLRPPRALWVPYPLGRPFGAPNDATNQTHVLRQALGLLEMPSGPILVDAKELVGDVEPVESWVCPVSFAAASSSQSDLATRVSEEVAQLRPWYELGVERRGRTTVGLANTSVADSTSVLARYVQHPEVEGQVQEVDLLRWSARDVISYYLEAATAQPGADEAAQLENWFWNDTAGGELLKKLREVCLVHADPGVRDVGAFMLMSEAHF